MKKTVYCGHLKDIEKVKQVASGGLATAMGESFIADGGIVYGAAYTSDFKSAEYIRVDTYDGIDRLKGSKYIKALLKKAILDSIKEDLSANRKVLFVGLSCDVNVVKEYLTKSKTDETNITYVDLICHGATNPKVAEQYVESLEKRYKSPIIEFSVKYKIHTGRRRI